MSEDEEPDWLAELAKGGEAARRQIEPLVQTAMELVQLARLDWPKTGSGTALPLSLRLAVATVNTRTREFKLIPTPVAVWAPPPPREISMLTPIVGSGSVALPRMGVAGQLTVEDRARGPAALNDGQIVVLVLLWLFAFVLPVLGPELPSPLHGVLSDSYATFALALSITWRIRDKTK
jgi:hypothetical protein